MNIYQKNKNNSHRCILTFEVPTQSLYEVSNIFISLGNKITFIWVITSYVRKA